MTPSEKPAATPRPSHLVKLPDGSYVRACDVERIDLGSWSSEELVVHPQLVISFTTHWLGGPEKRKFDGTREQVRQWADELAAAINNGFAFRSAVGDRKILTENSDGTLAPAG